MSKVWFTTGAGSGIGTAKAALKGGDPAVREGSPMRLAFDSLLFPIAAIASVAIAAATVTLTAEMDEFMRESDAAVSMVNAVMTISPSGEVGTDFGPCRRHEQLRRAARAVIALEQ